MADPFEALRQPDRDVDPDATFAARLRARVERALALPEGVTVSDLTVETDSGSEPGSVSDPIREGDIGYVSLWVPDAERATRFFSKVLGWSYDDHAEGQTHQVVGRQLHHGVHGGHERPTLYLCFVTDDMAAAVDRIRHSGGQAEEPTHEAHGLSAMCTDPEGTPFSLYQPPPGPRESRLAANGTNHGDLAYITMEVGDSAAVRAFYGVVLGWRFTPGRVEDGWGPQDVVPMTGLHGGHPEVTVLPLYRVDDIHVAVARVRGAGGSATVPEEQPYGVTSDCVDDQGTRFYLGQL